MAWPRHEMKRAWLWLGRGTNGAQETRCNAQETDDGSDDEEEDAAAARRAMEAAAAQSRLVVRPDATGGAAGASGGVAGGQGEGEYGDEGDYSYNYYPSAKLPDLYSPRSKKACFSTWYYSESSPDVFISFGKNAG